MTRTRRSSLLPLILGATCLTVLVVTSAIPAASGVRSNLQTYPALSMLRAPRAVEHMQAAGFRHTAPTGKMEAGLTGLTQSSRSSLMRPAGLTFSRDGKVRVVIEARRSKAARAAVARLGGRVESTWRNLVQAVVPAGALSQLARQRSVDFVRQPLHWVEQAVGGEEVAASLAPAWHAKGFTGKGVKVGIIDGGFRGYTDKIAAAELPSNVVVQDFCGGHLGDATEHGTAVAEIVHEMAPDAQLYLICMDSEVTLAQAEQYAKAQGIQIVNHSVGWYNTGRGDGSGPIGAIVQDARSGGILWVNAAGNEATTHWSGTFSSTDGDSFHNFAGNDEGNTFVLPSGAVICGFLRWDQWPAAQADFDLVLALSDTGEILDVSDVTQNGMQPPIEAVCGQWTGPTTNAYWAIYAYQLVGNPRLDLFSVTPALQYETAEGSVGDPATSPAALAVGALCWQTTGLEPYSSQGPTIDGRMKPDISGFDSVSGTTYGAFSSCGASAFAGTSAAAPNVAGAAALVKGAFPAYGPDQLQEYLVRSAKDLLAPGADNATGAGELQLPTPPDLFAPSAKALAAAGKKGKIVKLLSQASDDSGVVQIREQVKRNGQVIATLQSKFVSVSGAKTFTSGWRAPKKTKGSFTHCVRAKDKAGNVSKDSCAKISLK